jgi:hypothetical protein
LKRCECLFITSAVEAIDDTILQHLDKNHSAEDFNRAVVLLRQAGIAFAPTFVAFTPWTTLEGYIELLGRIIELKLVESVPPIQLCIRLLVPAGSYLLKLPGFRELIQAFDPKLLGYPWRHADRRIDRLQAQVQSFVAAADAEGQSRRQMFERIWRMAHEARGASAPALELLNLGAPIAHLSEPWYCCAEPTTEQLHSV